MTMMNQDELARRTQQRIEATIGQQALLITQLQTQIEWLQAENAHLKQIQADRDDADKKAEAT